MLCFIFVGVSFHNFIPTVVFPFYCFKDEEKSGTKSYRIKIRFLNLLLIIKLFECVFHWVSVTKLNKSKSINQALTLTFLPWTLNMNYRIIHYPGNISGNYCLILSTLKSCKSRYFQNMQINSKWKIHKINVYISKSI